MPKLQCVHPGCRVIIDKSDGVRCPKHKNAKDKFKAPAKRLDHQYDQQGRLIYATKRWKILSKKKLQVDCFCEKCWDAGREVAGDIVDHIEEIKDNPKLAYTWSNLMTLCHRCHNAKTHKVENERKEKAKIKKLGLYVM